MTRSWLIRGRKHWMCLEDGLALYLRLGYIPAPYAMLKNTYMLEPGAWLELDRKGQAKRGKFFEFPVYEEASLRGGEAYEAVDAAVTRAVRRQLVSDVPVGTFLSGGIDSPLVAAKARAASNDTVRCFTIGTNGDELDESDDAEAYAQQIGVEHIVEHTTPQMAFDMLDDVVTSCGEPFADYSVFPTMRVARLARRHVKVILSGDGGDELFWGYPSRFVSPLKYSADFRQPQWFRTLRWGWARIIADGNGRHDLRYKSIGQLYRDGHSRIDETTLKQVFPDVAPWPNGFGLFDYNGCEPNHVAQWLRWNEFVSHLTMVLLKVDRASMFHSLEVRVPLLDREVIDVASRVDWRSCLDLARRRLGKLPLRHALARHVRRLDTDETRLRSAHEALAQRPVERYFSTSRDRTTRNPRAAGQSDQGAGDVSRTQSRHNGSYPSVVDALEPRFVGKKALSQEGKHRTSGLGFGLRGPRFVWRRREVESRYRRIEAVER